ncbi:MAG: hypothetical protein Q9M28_09480, partial [Mariprofundaceae bacterium]|nr:hypothetical protein [Mariprofundaceae bacterium]
MESFLENVKNIISQVKDDTHTIILSSEGIYNYWWDFPDESKDILTTLHHHFDVEIWVWFREPLAFIESYYKQCIRNPQVKSNPCYGKDLSFASSSRYRLSYAKNNVFFSLGQRKAFAFSSGKSCDSIFQTFNTPKLRIPLLP